MSTLPSEPASTSLFPLFADLRGRPVLVVGGGPIARRKIAALLEAGADVTVVASTLDSEVRKWVVGGRVRHDPGEFAPALLDGVWLAIAVIDDHGIRQRIAAAAASRCVFLNVVDDADVSTFHAPARVRRGRLQVAVSTGGAAPVLARRVREKLETELDESLASVTSILARERPRVRWRFPKSTVRRRFLERLLDGAWPALVRDRHPDAQATFERALRLGTPDKRRGHVALVGAGPGDPGLLTLRALRALQDADVVVHDRLVSAEILDRVRRDAELIDAGKHVGEDHATTQAHIHALLLRHARAGRYVVRLQGGDPSVFGRAGEELEFLRSHAIACDVIPGVTAAIASAAAAGIALTDRRYAHGVTLLSARSAHAGSWPAPTTAPNTLAIYMGAGELERLTADLMQHGRSAATPCVLVERASLPEQAKLYGTLAEIATLARAQSVRAPALLIVGDVAARADRVVRSKRCSDGVCTTTTAA